MAHEISAPCIRPRLSRTDALLKCNRASHWFQRYSDLRPDQGSPAGRDAGVRRAAMFFTFPYITYILVTSGFSNTPLE